MGNTNSYTQVKCSDCDVSYSKRRSSLEVWQGRCRSCAQKLAKSDPELKARISVLARAQVLKQGGIPNARKFVSNPTREQHPHWKGGNPHCLDCGKTLAGYTSKRCSACFHATWWGEGHPRWKGGITPENHRIRTSSEYKDWRMAVFQRDRFTCVKCGFRSQYNRTTIKCDIRADHIKPFSLFPELRLEVSNGRTLCLPCDKIHGWHYNRDKNQLTARDSSNHDVPS